MILLEYQNIKTLNIIFVIKKVKNIVSWTYVISDLEGEEIIRTFYEKEFQKTLKKKFRARKVIKRKDGLNGKVIVLLTGGLIKKTYYK